MSELGAVWAALELFGSDFDRWPTVIIHSAVSHLKVRYKEIKLALSQILYRFSTYAQKGRSLVREIT